MIKLKRESDEFPIIVRIFNTSLQLIEQLEKKIRKNMEELRVFHMYKEVTYILEIIFGLLETICQFTRYCLNVILTSKNLTFVFQSCSLRY